MTSALRRKEGCEVRKRRHEDDARDSVMEAADQEQQGLHPPPEAGGSRRTFSFQEHGLAGALISDFEPPNSERLHFFCFGPFHLWPFVTKTLRNK